MDNRLFFTATKKNTQFIGDLIPKIFKKNGSILEIGSGSGEHGVAFQKRFPELIWQTSDPELIHRKSICSWINHENLNKKMPQPLDINVEVTPWKISLDLRSFLVGVISINMIHVASWSCTRSLFRESCKLLKIGQPLMLYGPFKIGNKYISESNNLFDQSLKMKNNSWGIRNLDEVSEEAKGHGFIQENLILMPANNYSVIYKKVF